MISRLLPILISLLLGKTTFTQIEESLSFKKNGIYAEAYLFRHDFNSGFVSLNYERTFGNRTYLRAGIYPDFQSIICFPITVTWLTNPKSHHHFEGGIGGVLRVEHYIDPYGMNSKEWFYDFPAIMVPLMYRYQGPKGFYFRIGANLFISYPTMPAPSLSLGYRF